MTQDATIETALRGRALLAEPSINKATAFTIDERTALGLDGLLPARVESIEEQIARTTTEFGRLHDDLERHIYLRALQDHNETLFYRFVQENLTKTLPIVYTPTVGLASQQFSRIYRRARGLFLAYPERDRMTAQLESHSGDVDVVVVTDGERVLGLGDQGVGGMAIPIGKLSLYSSFGGIDPSRTLPIFLDVGTNNEDLLADPLYLGWRNERIGGAEYSSFVEQFVTTLNDRFPGVLLQWEDFAQHNATNLLHTYRDQILSFNDDIQGTAAVALAAVWAGVREKAGNLDEQRFCIAGAGSAGTGIASMLRDALVDQGVSDPLSRLFLLDSKGLVHDRRPDLKPHQVGLAHPYPNVQNWLQADQRVDLATVVEHSGATVLIGVSGQPSTFTQPVVTSMMDNSPRPIIMPLSNPTSQAEATPADLLEWSDGDAIIATGSPFDAVTHNGTTHHFSQANNVYVFPGLGLGAVAVGARAVSDRMLMTAASEVTSAASGHLSDGILPPLDLVSDVSNRIAAAVARVAVEDGLADDLSDAEIDERIKERRWSPSYRRVLKVV